MLEDILKYVKEVEAVDFDTELKNRFTRTLVKDWRIKGNNRIDAMFGKQSIFSRAKISTTSIVSDCLFLECLVKNELTLSPVVSFKKGSIYNTEGRIDTIERSFVKNSKLDIVGTCQSTTFENCTLNKGTYINCKFYNCKIENGSVSVSVVDNETLTESPTTKFSALKRS